MREEARSPGEAAARAIGCSLPPTRPFSATPVLMESNWKLADRGSCGVLHPIPLKAEQAKDQNKQTKDQPIYPVQG